MAEGAPGNWFAHTTLAEFAALCRLPRGAVSGLPEVRFPEAIADRSSLAERAREFHGRAGTLTDGVEANIDRYERSAPCVRVAHQPNFLPAVNVIAQAAVCNALNGLLGGAYAEVFFLVDYDLNDDRRYRRATLPSLHSRTGTWTASAPPPRVPAAWMTREDAPAMRFVNQLEVNVRRWASQQISSLPRSAGRAGLRRRAEENLTTIVGALEKAAANARDLADFNAIFLSWIVNEVLGLPTLFISGTAALPQIAGHIEALWHARAALSRAAGVAPLWRRCTCGGRLAPDETIPCCGNCGADARVDDANVGSLAGGGDLIPRIVADDLLDGVAWGNIAGCDYRGGLPHYARSALAARRLGLRPLPMFLSTRAPQHPARHLIGEEFAAALEAEPQHPAAQLVASGRVSAVMPLLWSTGLNAARIAADMRGG